MFQYQNEFLEWLFEEAKDEKTIKAYGTILNQFSEWILGTEGQISLSEVKPIHIKEFSSYLKHNLNRSQATINKAIAGLKTFFNYLSDKDVINDNPTVRVKIQKIQVTERGKGEGLKWLIKEEQDRFLSYIDLEKSEFKRLRNLALVEGMLFTGLRISEITALKLNDVRISENIELVVRAGKQGKYATVTLSQKHSRNFRKWFKYRQSLTDPKYLESDYLFVSERTGRISERGVQKMIDKYATLASMQDKGISCHSFRHSFCKNLANAGVDIQTIADLARHSSINTTRIYVENSQKEKMDALNKM